MSKQAFKPTLRTFNDSAHFLSRMNQLADCNDVAITIGGLDCGLTIDEHSLTIVCGNPSLGLHATVIRHRRDSAFIRNSSFNRLWS